MATLSITQYRGLKRFAGGDLVQAPDEPALARTKVTLGAATEVTLDDECNLLRLGAGGGAAYLNFGTAAAVTAATATDTEMPSGGVEFFRVAPGSKFSHYDGVT